MRVPDRRVTTCTMADQTVRGGPSKLGLDTTECFRRARTFQLDALPRVMRQMAPSGCWRRPEDAVRVEARAVHDRARRCGGERVDGRRVLT